MSFTKCKVSNIFYINDAETNQYTGKKLEYFKVLKESTLQRSK